MRVSVLISTLSDLSAGQWAACSVLLFIFYWSTIFIYRITVHPLARFPGPKLAGATYWYEFSYDVWPNYLRYTFKLQELHEQYGPIVRINPRYIHINDPDFYDEIYAGGRRTNKDMWFMNSVDDDDLQMNGSTFQTMSHDQHKLRRGAVNQFFSKRSVRSLDSLLQEKVAFLMGRFHQHLKDGTILNLSDANSALTMDVISAYCFGTGVNVSTQPEYGRPYRKLMNEATQMNVPGRHFPTLFRYLQKLPVWIQLKMMPEQALMFEFNDKLQATINNIASGKQGSNFASSDAQHRTIFHQIVESDLPPKEKTPRRLFGESVVFMGAGTETTARTLSVTAFYILHTPGVLPKLLEELNRVMPTINSPVAATDIESLPWLTGCIHEGLRLAHGVPGRAPRIQPEHELRYKEWIIPRGTPVMESSYLIHMNPKIWPEPFKFNPQRWIDNPRLSKYLVPFSRGPRNCVGQNLAWAELYMMTAKLFRQFEMELYDTTEERDVLTKFDGFIGLTDRTSDGVRVRIVRERD